MTDEELHKLKDTSTLRTQKPKQLRRQGEVVELNPVDEYRRVYGAFELTKLKPFLLENNHSLHVITGGHIDLLSHLLYLLVWHKRIKHVFLSAWAISAADIMYICRLAKAGSIDTIEIVLGKVFPTKYVREWEKLQEMHEDGIVTNLYNCQIHSKLMLLTLTDEDRQGGGLQNIVIESSANCNMNPRVEQSCITRSDRLHEFYTEYLHEIIEDEEKVDIRKEVVKIRKNKNDKISYIAGASLFGEDDMGEDLDD